MLWLLREGTCYDLNYRLAVGVYSREYKALSTNGGDEDWVAFVPSRIDERYFIHFLEEYHFGSVVDEFVVGGGRVVISSHA